MYIVSAQTTYQAIEKARRMRIPIGQFLAIPWGISEKSRIERIQLLQGRRVLDESHLIGHFKDHEVDYLLGRGGYLE